jgi:hypothetical protein
MGVNSRNYAADRNRTRIWVRGGGCGRDRKGAVTILEGGVGFYDGEMGIEGHPEAGEGGPEPGHAGFLNLHTFFNKIAFENFWLRVDKKILIAISRVD